MTIIPGQVLTPAERQKRYRAKYPEKATAAARKWAINNPERARAIALQSHHRDPSRKLVQLAKARAKKRGLEFAITKADVVIPTHCPVLGIKLVVGGGTGFQDASPTLDRIDNRKGYTPDNILVVSWRANRLKCDATPQELTRIAEFYGSLT